MKRIVLLSLILMSSQSFAKEINVKVSGMVCSMCAQGIKKKFTALAEVKSINVDLDNKLVKINTKEAAELSDEQITNIIKEAGYNVSNIERK